MIWNNHSKEVKEGDHAFLSASQYAWIRYDQQKMIDAYKRRYTQQIGTLAHDYARSYISWGQKAKAGDKTGLFVHLLENKVPAGAIDINNLFKTWQLYVNDAVTYKMRPEQVLYYSKNAFGTSDAISFRKDHLRIFDFKTGVTKASFDQLDVYAALFCLEYEIAPGDIDIEQRIYQFGNYEVEYPTAEDIAPIMSKITAFDKSIERFREEGRYEIE